MNRKGLALALLSLLTLNGCAGFPGKELPPPDRSISTKEFVDSDWGAIVFSVTSDLSKGGEAVNASIVMEPVGKDSDFDMMYSMHDRAMTALAGSLGRTRYFDQANGRVIAKKLPAGTYHVTRWLVENGTGATIVPRYDLDPLIVEVREGEITYIGDFHFELETGENPFGITITGGAWPEVIDNSNRDLQVIRQIYPLIDTAKVELNIVDDTKWSFEYLNAKMNTLKPDTE